MRCVGINPVQRFLFSPLFVPLVACGASYFCVSCGKTTSKAYYGIKNTRQAKIERLLPDILLFIEKGENMRKTLISRLVLSALVLGLLCSLSGCNIMPTITERDVLNDILPEYPPYCLLEVNDIIIEWEHQSAVARCTKYNKYASYYGTVDVNAYYSISTKSGGWKYEGAFDDDDTYEAVVSVDLSGSYSCDGISFTLKSTDDPNVYTLYSSFDSSGSYTQKDITFKLRSNSSWLFGDPDKFWMQASDYLYDDYFTLALQNDELLITEPVYGVLASGLEGSVPVSQLDSNVGAGTGESY